MNYLKLFFLSLVFAITFFSACRKEDEEKPKNFLNSKAWRRALVDKNTSSNPAGRILYDPRLDCQIDDTYRFSFNGILQIDKGEDKCDQNELKNETLAYTYSKDNKELVIDGTEYTLAEESN